MSLKFGTSGLRGLATDLLDGAAGRYAVAFIHHLVEGGSIKRGDVVYVGQDLRDSSPAIARQCIAALQNDGMTPVTCCALPTPALALHATASGTAAIMVSGSHIPADRNGLKFYRPDGEIDKGDEQAILFHVEKLGTASELGDVADVRDESSAAWARYRERCLAILPERALEGLRVGIYQHSSVARDFFDKLLTELGADVVPLGRSEHFVPVDTEAVGDGTQTRLRAWAMEHELAAIISTDADADRPLVADERGEQIRGDVLGILASLFLDARFVVTPVTSNSGIDRALGLETVRTRVGSPFVIEAMMAAAAGAEAGSVVGFEANGGFLTGRPTAVAGGTLAALPTRDSALPILVALALATKGPLSEHIEALGLPVCLSDRLENFPVADSRALMERLDASNDAIAALLEGIGTPQEVDRTDGLRVALDDGRIVHLRPSGNAPEMRCYVEAAEPGEASTLLETVLSRLRP
ncbi:phosphomannomutase [Mesorhizobium sp. CAU 1741]|uniref:phosphomannomutase n=1 Tax=Mesorhizobium sp. CAU 1741 TaxID=3140366 RepID=UPI00325B25DE